MFEDMFNGNVPSQDDMVLRFMEDYGSITPAQAMDEIGCYRLSAVIFRLRKSGLNIKTTPVERRNRFGRKVRFARYSIVREEDNG